MALISGKLEENQDEYGISDPAPLSCLMSAKGTVIQKPHAKTETLGTITVTGYEDDEAAINRFYQKAGIIILVTSDKLTALEKWKRTLKKIVSRKCPGAQKPFRHG